MQAFYDIQYLFTVSETVFLPPPKVKSAVIRLRRNGVTKLGCDERLFVTVVKTAFNQRRKTIRNSIRTLVTIRPDAEPVLLDLRPEQLSVLQFEELTRWVDAHSAKNS
jgi:16S rRNA (adenine1518-N6/adenine1519-N6)-dimethyltransferase